MKIVFFEVFKQEQEVIKNLLPNYEISYFEEKLNEKTIDKAKDADVVSVFINSQVNKDIIDALPNLKYIATRSTGFDHIDHSYAESKGIKVSNVPAYGSHTVAEYTFALLLTLSRKTHDASNNIKQKADFSISSLQGFDLFGKTIGVIGTGKIGKNVITIAKGFGMNVLAYDLYPDLDFAKENNFTYKSLAEIIAVADVLTLHAPYTKENFHLLNKDNISLMKKGIVLINTARGELIDTEALVWGLKENIIAGVGLDVLEGERELKEEFDILSDSAKSAKVKDYQTLLNDHMLINLPNVIITPHIAFYSKEAEAGIIKTTTENIQNFVSGTPINLIK